MINIILASDNNYVPYLGVCLFSIIKNNSKEFKKMNIYILDDDITESSKKQLKGIIKEDNINLKFIKTKKIETLGNIPHIEREDNISLTTYARLFISSLIPDIDKALYLDCDALIVDSLKELYNTSLEEYSCGAVIDIANGIDLRKTYINMEASQKYYNAGVLLLNLKYWRENNIEEKLVDYLIKNKDVILYHDQDIINAVLSNSIKTIHMRYNLLSIFHDIDYKIVQCYENLYDFYDDNTINEALQNPAYLHFCGLSLCRPWINKDIKYRKLYDEYAKQTPFYESVFINDGKIIKEEEIKNNIYKSNIIWSINKRIPQKVFTYLAKKRTERVINNKIN